MDHQPAADDDNIISCPYNAEHRMRRHRMPYHIVNCRLTYSGPPLIGCPYNAMHMVPASEMATHLASCEDCHKNSLETYAKPAGQ